MAKILIVEDEKAINDLVKFNLELVGHDCCQVFDGETGLEEALKLKYDLIILDVMLPKYSGFEIMEYIEETPVIFVTARTSSNDKIKGLRLGADDYISVRFPHVVGETISASSDRASIDQDEVQSDIHTIIMYRLKALSSPNAFFTGADAIISVGKDPAVYSSMFPGALYYIPGYSADTDRDYILSILGGATSFTDLDRFTDLFRVSLAGEAIIEFSSAVNGVSVEVFPTDEMANFDWNS